MFLALGLIITWLGGFLVGINVHIVIPVPIQKTKTSDLYPPKGNDDGPNAS